MSTGFMIIYIILVIYSMYEKTIYNIITGKKLLNIYLVAFCIYV